MKKPKISIVIPTYNRVEYLKGCLHSIQKDTKLNNYEIVIVDSGSTDGTREFLSTQPNIRIIEDELRGSSKATIKGFKEAYGEYICWLNDDMIVEDSAITNMLTFLEREESNGVGVGAFYYCQGEKDSFNIKSFFGLPHADFGMTKTSLMKELNYWDESFIRYSVDIDFSLRIWERGLVVAGCRQAKLKHLFLEDEHRESSTWIGAYDYELFIKKWDKHRVDNLIFSVSEEAINRYFGDCEKLQYFLIKGLILKEKGESRASNDILESVDILLKNILKSKTIKIGNIAFIEHLLTVAGTWYLDLKEYKIAEGLLKFVSSLKVRNNEDEEIICQVAIASTQLGRLYSQQGKFIEAEEELKKALSLESPDKKVKANVLIALGNTYLQQQKYSEAEEEYKKALAVEPWDKNVKCNILIQIGSLYSQQQRYKEAEERFKEALFLEPFDRNILLSIYYALGSNYERQGKWSEAIERFNYVVNNESLSTKFKGGSHFHLGCIYKELGKEKDAKQHFEECLRVIPEHKKARDFLSQGCKKSCKILK